MSLQELIVSIVGDDVPVGIVGYDGTRLGPADPTATIEIRSENALRRMVQAPGELGLARAYVAGDIEFTGDIYEILDVQNRFTQLNLGPRQLALAARVLGRAAVTERIEPPPEEARITGRRHTRGRDAQAIAHHYDVSNSFYRNMLGPTMTYSCAVFADSNEPLDAAQDNKYELICRKLDLQPGMRLLDVGCGWGGMVMHAARHFGVSAVGVTVSRQQVELATARVEAAGLSDRVEIRFQDYRDIADGPFDAISSIGMFEHVGVKRLGEYFEALKGLIPKGASVLNHQITRPPFRRHRIERPGFMNRYIFPDGELMEVGELIAAMQQAGFEVRHSESLREHYAKTLRHWVANLEANWHAAVADTNVNRARIWRLYMAAAAVNFEKGHTRIDQILALNRIPGEGVSGLAWRPQWDTAPLSQHGFRTQAGSGS